MKKVTERLLRPRRALPLRRGPGDPARKAGYLTPAELKLVSKVLVLSDDRVLYCSEGEFQTFFEEEFGLDVMSPALGAPGSSQADRLNAILRLSTRSGVADVLEALLDYRSENSRLAGLPELPRSERRAYEQVITELRQTEARRDNVDGEPNPTLSSSSWTGNYSVSERIEVIRSLAPVAMSELSALAVLVEQARFNDVLTADAVTCLRELHAQIGDLLEAVEHDSAVEDLFARLRRNRQRLLELLQEGAKVAVVAPSMTIGVVHLLSALTGTIVDTQLVGTIYAAVLSRPLLRAIFNSRQRSGDGDV